MNGFSHIKLFILNNEFESPPTYASRFQEVLHGYLKYERKR